MLVSIGFILVVAMGGFNDMFDQINASNSTPIANQAASVHTVVSPIVYVFGFLALAMGALIAINAFE